MGGLARAVGRLLVMGGVLAAVLVTCLVVGVGTTIALALGIVVAGAVGLVGVVRRPSAPAEHVVDDHAVAGQIAMLASAASASAEDAEAAEPTAVAQADPEALMPRWRRPSLLEARRADPSRRAEATHTPLRFGSRAAEADLRIVRYAVVPVLDRPDEVLGGRLAVIGAGDEIEVVGSSGTYLEVICPSGERGWIHRTTVSQPSADYLAPNLAPGPAAAAREPEAEDALTALLAARGIQ